MPKGERPRTRSWWGWGWQDQALSRGTIEKLGQAIAGRFGWTDVEIHEPATLESLDLRAPRVSPPSSLESLCSTSAFDRASHTYGKSYRDVVRGFRGELDAPPDVVAFPGDENEVVALLDWCAGANVAAIPFGGGSSVVGGVEAGLVDDAGDYAGVVCIDLTRMDRVLEVDTTSRAARIQAGALGPVLEDQLREHDYTLRHFPQSFEFSTLGGWLATRSGGHYASVYTHIDDMVEAIRMITPAGVLESRRLPGSGAGPSPDRMILGSEGSLGVITEAWMRVQDRVKFKASAGVRFTRYEDAVTATRAVAQSGLFPTNCRLLDAGEGLIAAGVDDGTNLLVLGFESADHPVDAWIERAAEICQDHGGVVPELKSGKINDSVGTWKNSFLRAPYGRDALVSMAIIAETFETACTWDAFPGLHAGVTEAVHKALVEICGKNSGGWVTCRFTHVYPDGPAPYFSVTAPARWGSELEMWAEIKAAASEAVLAHGGTITHHHAVGRDHRPWYDRQRPDPFASALVAAKHALDPAGILNPGVLVDPA